MGGMYFLDLHISIYSIKIFSITLSIFKLHNFKSTSLNIVVVSLTFYEYLKPLQFLFKTPFGSVAEV